MARRACWTAVSKPSSLSLQTPSTVVPPGRAYAIHERDGVLIAVHSQSAAAHDGSRCDLLGHGARKSRAHSGLGQRVNVKQHKRTGGSAQRAERREHFLLNVIYLADGRKNAVGDFYIVGRRALAAADRGDRGLDLCVYVRHASYNGHALGKALLIPADALAGGDADNGLVLGDALDYLRHDLGQHLRLDRRE